MQSEFEEFVVDLDENEPAFECRPPDLPLPPGKRHTAGVTPVRCDAPRGSAQPAGWCSGGGGGGGGSGGGAAAWPLLAASALAHTKAPAEQHTCQQQPAGTWSLRSIFLSSGAERQPLHQQEASTAGPGGPPPHLTPAAAGSPSRKQVWQMVLACPSSPLLGFDAGNGDVGPLTQMAAANAPVAAAFCPHCGSFLQDLGSTQQQAQHVATCSHQPEAAAGAAAGGPAAQLPAAAVQQQQQHAGDASAGTRGALPGQQPQQQQRQNQQQQGGGLVSSSDDGGWEDDDAELGGNCSEQEGASQAAAEERLAAGQAGEEGGEAGEEKVAAAQAEQAAADAQAADEQAVLHAWLAQHGLEKYAVHFFRAGAAGQGCGRSRAQGGQVLTDAACSH